FARQPVRERDVRLRRLDVLDRPPAVLVLLHLALVLVQERDAADEREVLRVVAPRARAVVDEGQRGRTRIDDGERPQEALSVSVQREDLGALARTHEACERLAVALQ